MTAGSAAINGWTTKWTYANGQTVSQSWNATLSSSGSTVTARNVDYNGRLGAGASTAFGFLGSGNGSNPARGDLHGELSTTDPPVAGSPWAPATARSRSTPPARLGPRRRVRSWSPQRGRCGGIDLSRTPPHRPH